MRDKDGRGRKEMDKAEEVQKEQGSELLQSNSKKTKVRRRESQGESSRSLEVKGCFITSHQPRFLVL